MLFFLRRQAKFCIAWDNPIVRFPSQDVYLRKYVSLWNSLKQSNNDGETKCYQNDNFSRALQISLYGLQEALAWDREITDWQTELLEGCASLSEQASGLYVCCWVDGSLQSHPIMAFQFRMDEFVCLFVLF